MDRDLDPTLRSRRRTIAVTRTVALVLVALAVLATAPRLLRPRFARTDLRLATVDRGPLEAVLTASGTVVPAREEVLTAPVEARLERVLLRPGANLVPGSAILELAADEARLELLRREEALARATTAAASAELTAERAHAELTARRDSHALDAELATLRLTQRQRLASEGLVSHEALLEAEVASRKAAIERDQLDAAIALAARQRDADADARASELRLLQSERDRARARLGDERLRAARAGVLTWVLDEEGTTVRTGEPLARVADLTTFRVEASLADTHAGRIAVGQPARVRIGEVAVEATVARIDPAVSGGVLRVHLDLADPRHPALRPQLRVDADLVVGSRPDVLRIARGPATRGEATVNLYVVDGDRAHRRTVRLGLAGHDRVEVSDGLAPGETVIVSDLGPDTTAATIVLTD